MQEHQTIESRPAIDAALLAEHPELAVLTLDLPDNDGEPMENERDRLQMNLVLDVLDHHWKDRQDFYAAGNMFLYFCAQQARQIIDEVAEPSRPRRAFRGPDVFIVLNVDGTIRRRKWVVWEEGGRYPDVIFEFLSPSTRQADRTTKKELYEQVFRTPEYYWFDPYNARELQGWQMTAGGVYQAVASDDRGWLWSPALHLWIGRWEGLYKRDQAVWLRFYEEVGELVPTADEAAEQQAEAARLRAEAAHLRAEAAHLRAEDERLRAEAERTHAEAERARADVAEAEVARLRAELARLQGESH